MPDIDTVALGLRNRPWMIYGAESVQKFRAPCAVRAVRAVHLSNTFYMYIVNFSNTTGSQSSQLY